MKLLTKFFATSGVLLLLGSNTVLATEKSAISVIKNAYAYTGAMKQYAFDAIIVTEELDEKAQKDTYKHTVNFKVSSPNHLRADVKGDFRDRTNYIHHGTYTMVDHSFGYYGEIKASDNIDDTLDYILKGFGINAPLTALIFSDMGKRTQFKRGKYFGTKEVMGVECDYVAFKDKNREIHAWIATGDKPLVQAYSIIDTTSKERPRMNTTVRWKLDAKIDESDFIFTPSKDVTKISVESAN
jgi:hypothetical protein